MRFVFRAIVVYGPDPNCRNDQDCTIIMAFDLDPVNWAMDFGDFEAFHRAYFL